MLVFTVACYEFAVDLYFVFAQVHSPSTHLKPDLQPPSQSPNLDQSKSYQKEEAFTCLPVLKVRLRPAVGKSGVSNEGLLQLSPGLVVPQVLLIHDPRTQAEAELLLQAQDVARLPGDNMAAALLLDLLQILRKCR